VPSIAPPLFVAACRCALRRRGRRCRRATPRSTKVAFNTDLRHTSHPPPPPAIEATTATVQGLTPKSENGRLRAPQHQSSNQIHPSSTPELQKNTRSVEGSGGGGLPPPHNTPLTECDQICSPMTTAADPPPKCRRGCRKSLATCGKRGWGGGEGEFGDQLKT
jgi:hypothetical protein